MSAKPMHLSEDDMNCHNLVKHIRAHTHTHTHSSLSCDAMQGSTKCKTWKDKWTVVTEDGGLCAQYEHTLLITADGAEILTKL